LKQAAFIRAEADMIAQRVASASAKIQEKKNQLRQSRKSMMRERLQLMESQARLERKRPPRGSAEYDESLRSSPSYRPYYSAAAETDEDYETMAEQVSFGVLFFFFFFFCKFTNERKFKPSSPRTSMRRVMDPRDTVPTTVSSTSCKTKDG
jgi:hypothetical protein